MARRDAINSLPCPIDIVELRIDREKCKRVEDEICQLIRYDFSRFKVREVTLKLSSIYVNARFIFVHMHIFKE